MTEEAQAARREYQRRWYKKNREYVAKYQKAWRAAHPDKQQEYLNRYWERKAVEQAEQNGDTSV